MPLSLNHLFDGSRKNNDKDSDLFEDELLTGQVKQESFMENIVSLERFFKRNYWVERMLSDTSMKIRRWIPKLVTS